MTAHLESNPLTSAAGFLERAAACLRLGTPEDCETAVIHVLQAQSALAMARAESHPESLSAAWLEMLTVEERSTILCRYAEAHARAMRAGKDTEEANRMACAAAGEGKGILTLSPEEYGAAIFRRTAALYAILTESARRALWRMMSAANRDVCEEILIEQCLLKVSPAPPGDR